MQCRNRRSLRLTSGARVKHWPHYPCFLGGVGHRMIAVALMGISQIVAE